MNQSLRTALQGPTITELQEKFGVEFPLDGDALALTVNDELNVVVEIDGRGERIVVSASSLQEAPPMTEEEVRVVLAASSSAMQSQGIALGLHPVLDKPVAVWSGALADLRPGQIGERIETVMLVAKQVSDHLDHHREIPIEADVKPTLMPANYLRG